LLDRRHDSERPVMRPDTVPRRQNKGHVPMVRRFVDAVHERRGNTVLPRGVRTMTGRIDRVELGLALLGLRRKLGRNHDVRQLRP
jgi:hypothetical protein